MRGGNVNLMKRVKFLRKFISRWFLIYSLLFLSMCGLLVNFNFYISTIPSRKSGISKPTTRNPKPNDSIGLPLSFRNGTYSITIPVQSYYFKPIYAPRNQAPKDLNLNYAMDEGVWPEQDPRSDRIEAQLRYNPASKDEPVRGNKIIYLANNVFPNWESMGYGDRGFHALGCHVTNCHLTDRMDPDQSPNPDAILFRDSYPTLDDVALRDGGQIWIFFSLESPKYRTDVNWTKVGDSFNWTATYRMDSDIVTPYDKYVPGRKFRAGEDGELITEGQILSAILKGARNAPPLPLEDIKLVIGVLRKLYLKPSPHNFMKGKGKMVAWFVSNCDSYKRLIYGLELEKYVGVDRYGDCSVLKCHKSDMRSCYQLLDSDYKFYLSFENSECQDYITEKFFEVGLKNDIVPIVMGATKEEYTRIAPHQSFIHVDDFNSPAHLAYYLHILASNEPLYNSYLAWKEVEKGTFIDTKFWCRICSMLNHPGSARVLKNFYDWWNGPGVCQYP